VLTCTFLLIEMGCVGFVLLSTGVANDFKGWWELDYKGKNPLFFPLMVEF